MFYIIQLLREGGLAIFYALLCTYRPRKYAFLTNAPVSWLGFKSFVLGIPICMAEWPWDDRIILSPEGLAFVLHVPTCHWLSVCVACITYKATAGLRERGAGKEGGWAPEHPHQLEPP